MDGNRRLSLVVGAFVVATLLLVAGVLVTLGQGSGFLQPRYTLVTYFENVQGLVAGAPVRLAGKDVGTVELVSFGSFGGERPPVRVLLQVDARVQSRIRSDSVASIGTIGLLGDKYVSISMGTRGGQVLEEGAVLESSSPVDLAMAAERGTEAIDNIATLTENVNAVVEDFGEAMGGRKIAESMESLSEIVREIREGDGLLHSLIYDPYEGGGVQSLDRSLATLEEILNEVAHGDGVIHTLIYESPEDQDAVVRALEAAARLESILAKVDEGEGTVGLLVNDPSLYEDLQRLVGGARRSLVVRSLIRLSTDDGS